MGYGVGRGSVVQQDRIIRQTWNGSRKLRLDEVTMVLGVTTSSSILRRTQKLRPTHKTGETVAPELLELRT
jgi:hypothetical protein